MKKSMTSYLYALSESEYDILHEIVGFKYRKFKQIYWLLREYSDYIVALKYKEKTEKNRLKIIITLSGINVKNVAKSLQACTKDDDNATITLDKDKITIELIKEEGDA